MVEQFVLSVMFPDLPSPLLAGLHENELKELLNHSKDGRLVAYASQLADNLEEYIASTETKAVIRRAGYELGPCKVRKKALACRSSRKDEDRLEATIHQEWMIRSPKADFLRSFDGRQTIVEFIPSSQVPLFNKGGKDGKANWGSLDLLGCDLTGFPVIVELKIMRFGKGARPETPLRAMTEALAYAISLRKAWLEFEPEWRRLVGDFHSTIGYGMGLEITMLVDTDFFCLL
jgi:hypothetical protein